HAPLSPHVPGVPREAASRTVAHPRPRLGVARRAALVLARLVGPAARARGGGRLARALPGDAVRPQPPRPPPVLDLVGERGVRADPARAHREPPHPRALAGATPRRALPPFAQHAAPSGNLRAR